MHTELNDIVQEKINNLKIKNNQYNYEIECGIKNYGEYIKLGNNYKERLQIFIMCYVSKPKIKELEEWSLTDLMSYIEETDEYFNEDKIFFDEYITLVKGKEI